MSLVSFALRLTLTRLLRNRTLAREMIFNSPVDPLAEWKARAQVDESYPCIAIYAGRRTADVVGKASQGAWSTLEILINVILPPTPVEVADGVELVTSNTGGATVIDFVGRQIEAGLRSGPAPWQGIWDKLVVSIVGLDSRPLLYQIEPGVSVPCVELTLKLKTVNEPDFGVDLLPGWALLVTAMADDADYAQTADVVRNLIQNPAGMPDWRVVQDALGMSPSAITAIGIAPVDSSESDEPAAVSNIVFTDEDRRP